MLSFESASLFFDREERRLADFRDPAAALRVLLRVPDDDAALAARGRLVLARPSSSAVVSIGCGPLGSASASSTSA